MNKQFPDKLGDTLSGKSFRYIFENYCDIIQFVTEMWEPEKCTGIFRDFYDYVIEQLKDETLAHMHQSRCRQYVESRRNDLDKIPKYFNKYIKLERK